ncbi:envelope glycoprotein 24 [Mandrillus leucophaeus cytomegalovirus]|uniref:Envelope glycoprotein 24 n=1 Tax=Mandrillus leucophaeus cytomegalovirus TaxID=1654930 RepID=A0A0G2UPE1_9BETA|nr:envelope glycoprotein 24 [Mandrillus leucophaeus cytomegalovirus]AKI29771.1 envelope glycoprotein 24 [Mandrillus leucophaeus cytomegalovirus]
MTSLTASLLVCFVYALMLTTLLLVSYRCMIGFQDDIVTRSWILLKACHEGLYNMSQ